MGYGRVERVPAPPATAGTFGSGRLAVRPDGRVHAEGVLALQRQVGNRSVCRLLQRVTFVPGVSHDHRPSGMWWRIQASPDSDWAENQVCGASPPNGVVGAAVLAEFRDKPLALGHLLWYLRGSGRDYNENAPLDRMLRTDAGVARAIITALPASAPSAGTSATWLRIEQTDYDDQDLRFAFGAIDRLDVEVDYRAGTLHAWFQDRYEWHPYYPGLYTAFPDDGPRNTNCVHAAMVELKASGAADFWMKGESTVPLSVVRAKAASGSGRSPITL